MVKRKSGHVQPANILSTSTFMAASEPQQVPMRLIYWFRKSRSSGRVKDQDISVGFTYEVVRVADGI